MALQWIVAKLRRIVETRRLRAALGQMSERELKDIGLTVADVDNILRGLAPPTTRPPDHDEFHHPGPRR